MSLAICIGCGCDDFNACWDDAEDCGCHWLRVNRQRGLGVCSACEPQVEQWDRGDLTTHAAHRAAADPDIDVRPPPREQSPSRDRPAHRPGEPCPHDWPYVDVHDADRCRWCGMTFTRYVHTEAP